MRSAFALCGALALACTGCSESTVPAGPAQHLTLVSGGGQRGQATDSLAEMVAVRLVDDAGLPVAGATIVWSSPDAGGHFIPATNRTDTDGLARTRWVLGVRSGPQSSEAKVEGWNDRIGITAEAAPGFKAVELMRGDPWPQMCAIDADARTWCWDDVGADPGSRLRELPGGHRFRALAGGYERSCGITEIGELLCWGGYSESAAMDPVRIGGDLRFGSIDIEHPMACAVTVSNDGYCWGRGIFGDGQPARVSEEPVLVAGGHAWREIAVSSSGACGSTIGGEVLCWTDTLNALVRMGLAGSGPFLTPTPVAIVRNLTALTGGDVEQCGLIDGGTSALCWGWPGSRHQPGSGAYAPAPNLAFRRMAAAYNRSAGLDSRGTVWAWNHDFVSNHGFFDRPTPLVPEGVWSDVSATGGAVHAILAADSTVHVWRHKVYGYGWKDVALENGIHWPYPAAIRAPSP